MENSALKGKGAASSKAIWIGRAKAYGDLQCICERETSEYEPVSYKRYEVLHGKFRSLAYAVYSFISYKTQLHVLDGLYTTTMRLMGAKMQMIFVRLTQLLEQHVFTSIRLCIRRMCLFLISRMSWKSGALSSLVSQLWRLLLVHSGMFTYFSPTKRLEWRSLRKLFWTLVERFLQINSRIPKMFYHSLLLWERQSELRLTEFANSSWSNISHRLFLLVVVLLQIRRRKNNPEKCSMISFCTTLSFSHDVLAQPVLSRLWWNLGLFPWWNTSVLRIWAHFKLRLILDWTISTVLSWQMSQISLSLKLTVHKPCRALRVHQHREIWFRVLSVGWVVFFSN